MRGPRVRPRTLVFGIDGKEAGSRGGGASLALHDGVRHTLRYNHGEEAREGTPFCCVCEEMRKV